HHGVRVAHRQERVALPARIVAALDGGNHLYARRPSVSPRAGRQHADCVLTAPPVAAIDRSSEGFSERRPDARLEPSRSIILDRRNSKAFSLSVDGDRLLAYLNAQKRPA